MEIFSNNWFWFLAVGSLFSIVGVIFHGLIMRKIGDNLYSRDLFSIKLFISKICFLLSGWCIIVGSVLFIQSN